MRNQVFFGNLNCIISVSYTHLDVYKRQILIGVQNSANGMQYDKKPIHNFTKPFFGVTRLHLS